MWDEDKVEGEDPFEAKYNGLIEIVKKEAAKREHDSTVLRRLAAELRQFPAGYKDAAAIADECERVARNQELKTKYVALVNRMDAADNEEDFNALAGEFRALGAYPNASAKAEECERRYYKLADERARMETKTQEQHYYTEYIGATAEMERLSQQKTFKPNEFRRLGDEWLRLSERFNNIDRYNDAQTLAGECEQKSVELYEKATLAKKLWMYAKIAAAVILLVVIIILVISLINNIRSPNEEPEQLPEEPAATEEPKPEVPQIWNDAYSEFLQESSHSLSEGGTDAFSRWGTKNIRFAELVDFDNNGTPELVLILDIPALKSDNAGNSQYNFWIFSYTDDLIQIYDEFIVTQGGFSENYAIATSADGQNYLVSRFIDNDGSISKNYLTLSNGQWTPVLSVDFTPGNIENEDYFPDAPVVNHEDEEDETATNEDETAANEDETAANEDETATNETVLQYTNDEFLIDGEQVSEAEFNAAESELLGIVRTRILGVDTENTVQTLIARLGDTYMYGNIPAGSSLREPLYVQLSNAILQGNDAVRLPIKWNSYGSTILIREADSADWKMITRNGNTGEVLPTFELEDDALTIKFPTTDKLYYLLEDFTGRFSNPDGSDSESFTWTFVIG